MNDCMIDFIYRIGYFAIIMLIFKIYVSERFFMFLLCAHKFNLILCLEALTLRTVQSLHKE